MISIQEAKLEDAKGILEVQRKTWLTTYPNEQHNVTLHDIKTHVIKLSEERWKKTITEDNDTKVWIAKENNHIAGFCVANKQTNENHLRALYVLLEHQGRGIGNTLTKRALEWLGSDKDIFTRAVNYNSRAILFYKSFGFEEIGLEDEKDWYRFPSGNVMKGIILRRGRQIDSEAH